MILKFAIVMYPPHGRGTVFLDNELRNPRRGSKRGRRPPVDTDDVALYLASRVGRAQATNDDRFLQHLRRLARAFERLDQGEGVVPLDGCSFWLERQRSGVVTPLDRFAHRRLPVIVPHRVV
jgi:hypothetical protein